jgi:glycosyltransferase involved in cell wall biosynthesis
MRILIVTHAGGSPHHGPNMRWYHLGQALKSKNIEIEIVSSSSFHKYIDPPQITNAIEHDEIDGLQYHWLRTRPYKTRGFQQVLNQLQFVFQVFRFSKVLADRKPDLVIASSPHPFVVFPARRIAKKLSVPFLYEVRDLWPELLMQLGGFGSWHPYIALNKLAEKYAVKHANLILSVKPGDADYFAEKYAIDRDRCAYIPNGFFPGHAGTTATNPTELSGLRNRYKYLVGYVGAISRYYGLEELVRLADSFRHRQDVGFVIFGGGDQAQDIERLASDCGLQNFHMLGKIPRNEVDGALKLFDVCYVGLQDLDVHKYGISCNKIYEYMFNSRAILGCYQAGHDPVVAGNCGITVSPGNTAELAEALQCLLSDDKSREQLGSNGRIYFEAHHHFSKVADLLMNQLGSLMRVA